MTTDDFAERYADLLDADPDGDLTSIVRTLDAAFPRRQPAPTPITQDECRSIQQYLRRLAAQRAAPVIPVEALAAARHEPPHSTPADEIARLLDAEGTVPDASVRMYLDEVARAPILETEDEKMLGLLMRAADAELEKQKRGEPYDQRTIGRGMEARRRLTESGLHLVVSVAGKYSGHGVSLSELIERGNAGLTGAVEKFDPTRGYSFSTYAGWWIRRAITSAISGRAETQRLPVHMIVTINKIVRVSRRLLQELGREPTEDEIGQAAGLPAETVREAIRIAQTPISLQSPPDPEENSGMDDVIPRGRDEMPEDAALQRALRAAVDDALLDLTDREGMVLRFRFGLDGGGTHTPDETADRFNVSRERVRQIEARAMRKLRRPSTRPELRDFLEGMRDPST